LPVGATASFSSSSCTPTCSTTMTIYTTSSTPVGTYNLGISGSEPVSGASASANVTLSVRQRNGRH
jgi:hypothetical protein